MKPLLGGWFDQSHDHGWSWTMNDPAKKPIRRLEEIDASIRGKDGSGIKKRKEQWKRRAKRGSEGKPGRTLRHTCICTYTVGYIKY
jgi:hypothetical protein